MYHPRMTYRPKPDGDIDPAGEAGWFLQRERERRGETLAMAGEACGVHPHHLQAIELGDLTRLPARTEALRMIGAYGAHLGFDPQPLVLHYAQFLPKPIKLAAAVRGARPRPLGSAKIICFRLARDLRTWTSRSGGIVASSLMAIILFGATIWALTPVAELARQAERPLVPAEEIQPGIQTGPDTPVASITSIIETPLADIEEDSETALADRAAGGLSGLADLIQRQVPDGPAGPTEAVETVPPPPIPGRAYGTENADARLVLRAKAPVWVRIEDRKGNLVMTQTLLAGDSYRVPNRSDLVIIARDGGLLSVEIDGISKGSLGAPGEILVGRPLDLAGLDKQG